MFDRKQAMLRYPDKYTPPDKGEMPVRPKIGLVLGGGGSRGLAHVGVLQVLEREQIPIDLIVGTSMGAIIGVSYACGYSLPAITDFLAHWQGSSVLNVNLFSARARQRSISDQLLQMVGDKTFADLTTPAAVMAVDMLTGQEIVLAEGSLLTAMLASSAVPAVFPPVELDGMQLVDGGVIDSLAVAPAFDLGMDRVIAVDLDPPLDENTWSNPLDAIMGIDLPFNMWSMAPGSPSMVSALWRSIQIMKWNLHQQRLLHTPPQVLLQPQVQDYGSLDFTDFEGPLAAGVASANAHLSEIRALLEVDETGGPSLALNGQG